MLMSENVSRLLGACRNLIWFEKSVRMDSPCSMFSSTSLSSLKSCRLFARNWIISSAQSIYYGMKITMISESCLSRNSIINSNMYINLLAFDISWEMKNPQCFTSDELAWLKLTIKGELLISLIESRYQTVRWSSLLPSMVNHKLWRWISIRVNTVWKHYPRAAITVNW